MPKSPISICFRPTHRYVCGIIAPKVPQFPSAANNIVRLFLTRVLQIYLVFGGMIGYFIPQLARAQTKFDWADSRYDISHYKYIDVCLAVRERVTDSAYARTEQWVDTLHYSEYNKSTPLLESVVAATKRCLAPFPPDRIAASEFTRAQELYLVADMDVEAKAVVDRRIKAISQDSVPLLIRALDTTISVYLTAQPMRLRAALDLYEEFERLGSAVPVLERVKKVMRIVDMSHKIGDSVNEARGFAKMLTLAKSMTDVEWTSIAGEQLCIGIRFAIRSQYHDQFSQALAMSTEKFKTLEGELFAALVGRDNVGGSLGSMAAEGVGTSSQPVFGDYWFPVKAEGITYPRLGVVTLIFPVPSDQDWMTVWSNAAINRFKARWPELEIILIGNTHGYFKEIEPPPPEVEAAYVDSVFRQFHNVPAVLAVEKTKYWRMPGLDRRRVDEPTENAKNGRGMVGDNLKRGDRIGSYNMELIDKEGKIVAKTTARFFEGELWLERLIPVLINRAHQTR